MIESVIFCVNIESVGDNAGENIVARACDS